MLKNTSVLTQLQVNEAMTLSTRNDMLYNKEEIYVWSKEYKRWFEFESMSGISLSRAKCLTDDNITIALHFSV